MPVPEPEEIKKFPAYTLAEAARLIEMSPATVRAWFRGENAVFQNEKGMISFIELVQAHVLHTIRKGCHIPMSRVRKAAATLEKIGGGLTHLAHQDFFHDRQHLFLVLDQNFISLSESGQFVDREIIKDGLTQLVFGADGFTDSFFPKANGHKQTTFAISPKVNFGRLHLATLGVGAEAIWDRFSAAEGIADIAADYGAQPSEIEEAIRWHGRLAA